MLAPLRLSHSSMETFAICAYRWYLLKIQQVRRAPIRALINGTAIHAALEADGRQRMAGGALTLDELRTHYDAALDETLGLEDPEHLLAEALDALRRQGHATLRAYADLVTRISYQPIEIELPFEFSLSEDLIFTGRIDAITEPFVPELARQRRTIIDFKSATRRWEVGAENRKDQATAYIMASERLGNPAECVTFVVFPYSEETGIATADPRLTRRTPGAIAAYHIKIQKTAAAIRASLETGQFSEHPGPYCAWCECRGSCPAGESFLQAARIPARVPAIFNPPAASPG